MLIKSNSEDINWMIRTQFFVIILGSLIFFFLGKFYLASFLVGALLVTLNFLILARKLPFLIKTQKGSVFSLLVSFYFRLLFTGVVLFFCIAVVKFPVLSLLIGLSTVIITIMLWALRFILLYKHKEA